LTVLGDLGLVFITKVFPDHLLTKQGLQPVAKVSPCWPTATAKFSNLCNCNQKSSCYQLQASWVPVFFQFLQLDFETLVTGIPTAFPTIKAPAVEQCLTEITKIRHEALAAHELARQLIMRRNKGTYEPFKLGDSVWLDSHHLNIPYESNKLKPKRVGPLMYQPSS
jgi:hypothetical protein